MLDGLLDSAAGGEHGGEAMGVDTDLVGVGAVLVLVSGDRLAQLAFSLLVVTAGEEMA